MNINFELYKLFYYVCKFKNITKASEYLLISQPGISKAIKNLEGQLNCVLFIRNKNGVILTEEAEILYEELKSAIEIIENAENKLKEAINLEYGTLNIGVSKTITEKYLLPYLKKFSEEFPNININIHTDYPDKLVKKVRNGLIHFIILNLPYDVPKDFECNKLIEVHDIFVATDKYNELKNKVIKLEDLNNYPLILQARHSNTRYNLDNVCDKYNIKLIPKMELASSSLVTEFIKSDFGIGLVTKEYLSNELEKGELFEIETIPKINNRYIGYIYLKNKSLNSASKKLINMLKKY